ncbi:MAG TPA: response regulator transcription factor, partial [Planctomycetota bacterium]|nr:response regulator transcription factor [Planctomycetota bacterium]
APRTEVMVVSVDHSASVLRRVLEAGARGYVLKSDTGPTIVAGIQSLLEHKPFFSTAVSEAVLGAFLSAGAEDERRRLTPREVEVLQLLAEGKTTKEIAATLEIGVKTAETHRANVMNKAGARTTSELARYAVRLGIIEG